MVYKYLMFTCYSSNPFYLDFRTKQKINKDDVLKQWQGKNV